MKRFTSLNKQTCLVLLMLFMLTGCATVKIEMGGMPATDHVKHFTVLGLDITVNATYAYFYKEAEGEEYLDTLQYFGVSKKAAIIEEAVLSDVKLICRIHNPNKEYYTIKVLHKAYDDRGRLVTNSRRQFYSGTLSLKNLSSSLPKAAGFEHRVWLVISDKEDVIRYQDIIPIRYKILAK